MLAQRPTRIDALTRPDHKFLTADDRCYFLGEYTARIGFGSATNDLILNFKIPPSELRKNPARRRWKDSAIAEVGRALGRHLSGLEPGGIVVPIPTSKLAGHSDYDDRLLRALAVADATPALAVRELIRQRASTPADHEPGGRQSLGELSANCYVDEGVAPPLPASVLLFDDVLTEGKHFRVCQQLLRARFGNEIPIAGFFIARRVHPSAALDFDRLLSGSGPGQPM